MLYTRIVDIHCILWIKATTHIYLLTRTLRKAWETERKRVREKVSIFLRISLYVQILLLIACCLLLLLLLLAFVENIVNNCKYIVYRGVRVCVIISWCVLNVYNVIQLVKATTFATPSMYIQCTVLSHRITLTLYGFTCNICYVIQQREMCIRIIRDNI